ncbi:hypothetical protein GCM10025881_26050 [Pseudolysinimonas kribbensis]|uniref:Fibronectin type-III domain-containing protein n=1 Tax=Pseudolysinimonas kribbensis TaxID=433641 RepID=A0ABQ6KAV7_9MICO|nr:fibronectin type III domain-containing protein [Pseudolysinimonas kribbensis]GMA95781.1 hypothetical protein GCM10025881_26050 [Pseudolysinimonas kribbensis]
MLRVGSADIVGAGGGGNGGSGQFAPTRGRQATATYAGRTDSITTAGQNGTNANDICSATNCSNNDGGGGGAGGGGAQGGQAGAVEFGAAQYNEWFGYGGSVGQNSTASYDGLAASYQWYNDNGGTGQGGSIVISYTTGSPAAPTAVSGVAGSGSVALAWTAPTDPGQSAITGYVARFSSNGGSSWSSSADLGTTGTSGTVTGLTNGTAYVFQVAAVNSVGTGAWSASSTSITPQGPPSAPTISSMVGQDGALRLTLTAPASGATVTGYDYRVDGGGWVAVASTATIIVIPGLLNGTSYDVEVRAESAVGAGSASASVSGTPRAVPGAPTIGSVSAGAGSITVAFTTGFTGGDEITGYEYRLNGAGSWLPADGATSPIVITGLDNGTSYSVELRAVNGSGTGAASAPATIITPDLPGAPAVASVLPGDGTATVVFTPGSTGGTPVDHLEVQTSAGGDWTRVGATSPVILTGLDNGTTYAVSLRAVNAVGAGAGSAPVAVTPATVPGAPSIIGDTVAGGDETLSAAFTAPGSDGGAAITRYQYSTDGGATWRTRTDGATTASPVVITAYSSDGTTPLVNGTTYYVELRAVNSVGAGTASAVAQGIATTIPSAPTITSVVAAPASLDVTFAPGANGGSAITGYRYSVDGQHWASTGTLGTTFTITGLSNGTAYPVQVQAVNDVGQGTESAAMTGTPVALPGRASIVSVVRSNQTLTAAVALTDDGGSPVTSWQYSTDGGISWGTASGTTSPLVLTTLSGDPSTRLANGTGYSLLVRAVTAIGTGPSSAATTVAPAAAPPAPSIALTPGNGQVVADFSLGGDGGSPIEALEYSLDGTTWMPTGTLASPFTITGLTNGTAYAIRLRADNAIGAGAASTPASTTPRTVPGAPTAVVTGSNTASADVRWAAPADNGGAAITGYTASAYASGTSGTPIAGCSTTATSCSISGLTNKTAYYVAVTATNAAGAGAPSAPRTIVTPLARPSAPTITGLTAGDGSLSAAFTAGAIGDGTLIGYQYSVDGGSTWAAAGTTSPIAITGLTDGTAYRVAVRAVSTAGTGAASAAVAGTPYGYPSAPDPTGIVVNGGNGKVIVSWQAPSLNGGVLGDYTATAFSAQSSGSTAGTCTTTALSCTITGLGNGTTYWISLQTRNSVSMYSQRSDPRVPATPSMTPGAPTGVSAVAADGAATIAWTAPTSTGASAISGYTVLCSSGGAYTACGAVTGTATTLRVTGLTNGTAYTFQVTATNGNGSGTASAASTAVTPLAPGATPVFGTPSRTADGIDVAITNYDPAVTYTVSASAGTVTRSGPTITVTGLAASASSTVTLVAARTGYTTVSASVAGSALANGVAPAFSGLTAAPDGFAFTIANYDAASSYAFSATHGATVSRDGAVVTVSGLALGGGSRVTVVVSRTGSTDATAAEDGVAMTVGTAPVLTGLVSTGTGFRFEISDYDAALDYAVSATNGAAVTRTGSTVTVTGLTDGAASDVTVTATDPGVSIASALEHGAALLAGSAPSVSDPTSTVDGFVFDVDLPDSSAVYSVTSSAGTAVLDGGVVTVTGLTPGETADVTVTSVEPGHVTTSTTVRAAALLSGIPPLFAAPSRTADGFTVAVDGLDPDGVYTVASTTGSASVDAGVITVTGLAPDAAATVTVTVRHAGYTDGVSTVTGTALAAGVAPAFADVTATADGFTFTIANYDAALVYETRLSPTGVVVIDGTGHGVVSGVGAGVTVTLDITATDPGASIATASTGATVLLPTTAPGLSAATPLAGGYRFVIEDYDPGLTYSFVQADGGTVVRSGDTVTVSGLGAAVTSVTTVSATSAGHTVAASTASGTSFPNGTAPGIGAVTRTLDGFTFTFTADPAASYTATADAGTATLSGSTVTVTGLGAGIGTTVHLTATVPGSLDATSDVAGTAIALGVAPVLGAAISAHGGFVVVITDYSALGGYRVATTAGSVTRSGDRVTVSGLAAGASATVTVTAVRGGYRDASAARTGSAIAPVVPAAPTTTAAVPTPAEPRVSSADEPTESSQVGGAGIPASLRGVNHSTPGTGTVQSGGDPVPSRISTHAGRTVLTTGNGLRMTVSGWQDGHRTPTGPDGVIEIVRGGSTQIDVSGLAPDSEVVTWGMSHLQQLVATRTDHDGSLAQLVRLPYSMAPGAHTLIVSGVDAEGHDVTMQVGIRVLPVAHDAPPAPAAGGSWWWLLLVGLIALLALITWFVIARRRRHDREARVATGTR